MWINNRNKSYRYCLLLLLLCFALLAYIREEWQVLINVNLLVLLHLPPRKRSVWENVHRHKQLLPLCVWSLNFELQVSREDSVLHFLWSFWQPVVEYRFFRCFVFRGTNVSITYSTDWNILINSSNVVFFYIGDT